MLTIDGSYGLGSGQLTRFALAFSALAGVPVHITNIRFGRPNPGLKPQHLHALLALQQLCTARVEGASEGSDTVTFTPGVLCGGSVKINIGTAGSITLLLQNLLLPALFCREQVVLDVRWGTDVAGAPTLDYFQHVIVPFFQPYTQAISLEVRQRGYYPKGGGRVVFSLTPKYHRADFSSFEQFLHFLRAQERPLSLTMFGAPQEVMCYSIASDELQKASVTERQVKAVQHLLGTKFTVRVESSYVSSLNIGSSCCVVLSTSTTRLGGDALGAPSKRAEVVGAEACVNLLAAVDAQAGVDAHAADHLVPLLVLLTGTLRTSEITEHTKTALWVLQHFLEFGLTVTEKTITVT